MQLLFIVTVHVVLVLRRVSDRMTTQRLGVLQSNLSLCFSDSVLSIMLMPTGQTVNAELFPSHIAQQYSMLGHIARLYCPVNFNQNFRAHCALRAHVY